MAIESELRLLSGRTRSYGLTPSVNYRVTLPADYPGLWFGKPPNGGYSMVKNGITDIIACSLSCSKSAPP